MKKRYGGYEEFGEARGKTINFGKSSGGKADVSHLGKLDTSKETIARNYVSKHLEEKSVSSFKTITRSEFQRRRSSFENIPLGVASEAEKPRGGANFPEKRPLERDGKDARKARSLEDLKSDAFIPPGAECRIRENKMTENLKEIHDLIEKMQEMTRKLKGSKMEGNRKVEFDKNKMAPVGKEIKEALVTRLLTKDIEKKKTFKTTVFMDGRFRNYRPSKELVGVKPRWNLKRKFVPIRYSSSFTTKLGSTWKTFSEEVIFQNKLVLSPAEGFQDANMSGTTGFTGFKPRVQFQQLHIS